MAKASVSLINYYIIHDVRINISKCPFPTILIFQCYWQFFCNRFLFKSLKFSCQEPADTHRGAYALWPLLPHWCWSCVKVTYEGSECKPSAACVHKHLLMWGLSGQPPSKTLLTIPHQNPSHTPLSSLLFSGPHLVSLTHQSTPLHPILPSTTLPSAAEQWCYLPISPYWSPERAQDAGNQDPQTVLWRKRREWDNRLDDEGNDFLKTAGIVEVGIADNNSPPLCPSLP